MSKRSVPFHLTLALLALVATFGGSGSAIAAEGVQVISAFNPADAELPEGLIIDKTGNIYVSVGHPFWFPAPQKWGAIWKISPNGETTVLATFPDGPAAAGLAVSPSGVLYYAYPNPADPATNGVYRLDSDGVPERLPGSESIVLSNGLALSEQGDLYVSDSVLGIVWRFPHDGGALENWFQHPWLAGCLGIPGANGVALWHDSVYVANTGLGLLARVPILRDGSSGEVEIVAGDPDCDPVGDALFGLDGIALDVHGGIYALSVLEHKLVRIDPSDGSHTVLLTAEDGLFNPASIAFGTGKGDRQSVFISNFALLEPGPPGNLGPGVLKLDVGTPGLPLP
jgi:sugar lactone lactonase YvrE